MVQKLLQEIDFPTPSLPGLLLPSGVTTGEPPASVRVPGRAEGPLCPHSTKLWQDGQEGSGPSHLGHGASLQAAAGCPVGPGTASPSQGDLYHFHFLVLPKCVLKIIKKRATDVFSVYWNEVMFSKPTWLHDCCSQGTETLKSTKTDHCTLDAFRRGHQFKVIR